MTYRDVNIKREKKMLNYMEIKQCLCQTLFSDKNSLGWLIFMTSPLAGL